MLYYHFKWKLSNVMLAGTNDSFKLFDLHFGRESILMAGVSE